jgi:myo-inositol-1(or 4)-monophosphatase
VTETDQSVEEFVSKQLGERYPSVAFIGEESYKAGELITDVPTFVVDPIDGTSNFVHGFPAVCIAIGLVVGRQPTVGVVYNPFRDELWTAVKGAGAYTQRAAGEVQQLPLISAPLRGLGPACIGIEWGSDREGPNFELNLKVFSTLARTSRTGGRFVNSLRCTGSAAITICRIAAGQQDMFWECGCWAWDVAAAWCILAEAGGMMVDGHPGNWNPPIDNRRYLAVRPATSGQREIVEEFWSVIGDDRSTYGPP